MAVSRRDEGRDSALDGDFTRSDSRGLRQQLAHFDETCQRLSEKLEKLQADLLEARQTLERERIERQEERNNQLAVVVAKHALVRRLRNNQANLQVEWQANIDLKEQLRRMEDELKASKKVGCGCGQRVEDDDMEDLVSHIDTSIETPAQSSSSLKRKRMDDDDQDSANKTRRELDVGYSPSIEDASHRLQDLYAQIRELVPGAKIVVHGVPLTLDFRRLSYPPTTQVVIDPKLIVTENPMALETLLSMSSDGDAYPTPTIDHETEHYDSTTWTSGRSVVDQMAAGAYFPFVSGQPTEAGPGVTGPNDSATKET